MLADWQPGATEAATQLQELIDEAAILDLIVSYVSSHDAKDLDWTLSVFSPDDDRGPDGVPRRQGLAQQYTMYNQLTHNFSRHRIANIVVRLFPGGDEAWLTGYWHVSRSGYPGDVTARFGHYFWRVVKQGGRWLIADRRGSGVPVFESEFSDDDVPPGAMPPAADPGRDWIAADRELWVKAAGGDALARLTDERHARDLLAFYSYALDAQDWNWLGTLFDDEAIMSGRTGQARGRAAIIDSLRGWQTDVVQSTHRCANPVLRVAPGGGEAWLSASYHFSTMAADERRASIFGRYFGRLIRHSGGWRIAEWRALAEPAAALLPASNRSRRLTMPEIPAQREQFDAIVNHGAWSARKWLIDLPLPPANPLPRLTAELELRELLVAYVAALDAKDLERALDFFAEDAVITTAAGRFRYGDRIRDYFAANFRNRAPSFHRLMNTAVRLAPGGTEAWLSTYFYAVRPGQRRVGDGHLLGRVSNEGAGWKFRDLVISMDRARYFPAS